MEMTKEYEAAARRKGDDVKLITLEGAGHFEVIAPQSSVWPTIQETMLSLLGVTKPAKRG
jgi:hypothetical protein